VVTTEFHLMFILLGVHKTLNRVCHQLKFQII
jgi:hypothetical protein